MGMRDGQLSIDVGDRLAPTGEDDVAKLRRERDQARDQVTDLRNDYRRWAREAQAELCRLRSFAQRIAGRYGGCGCEKDPREVLVDEWCLGCQARVALIAPARERAA